MSRLGTTSLGFRTNHTILFEAPIVRKEGPVRTQGTDDFRLLDGVDLNSNGRIDEGPASNGMQGAMATLEPVLSCSMESLKQRAEQAGKEVLTKTDLRGVFIMEYVDGGLYDGALCNQRSIGTLMERFAPGESAGYAIDCKEGSVLIYQPAGCFGNPAND